MHPRRNLRGCQPGQGGPQDDSDQVRARLLGFVWLLGNLAPDAERDPERIIEFPAWGGQCPQSKAVSAPQNAREHNTPLALIVF